MKNLIRVGERRRRLNLEGGSADRYLVDTCRLVTEEVDSNASIIVLTNDGTLSRMTESGDIRWTCDLKEFNGTGWFDVSFVDPELVCLSRNGAIVTVSPTNGQAELVGEFDHGLETAAWSPDGEVLVMITSAADEEDETKTRSVLLSMNSQLEVLAEVPIPQYIPLANSPDYKISVAWRPDGSLCSVSSVDKEDNVRKIRIYKRETLELHAIGRAEDASGAIVKNVQNAAIGWAGPGCSQILTAVQRKGKKTQQVIFFESNGLRHREFVLRETPETTVLSVAWNVTSDLLALALRGENGSDKIQIWHRCNYHWYMKHEILYPNNNIEKITFDAENAYEFHVILRSLEWREYELRWDPSTTWGIFDRCLAFVIDGCSLNITPLEKALIPPPMSMNAVKLESPILDLNFYSNTHQPGFGLASLSNSGLILLTNQDWETSVAPSLKLIVWGDQQEFEPLSLRSFCIVDAQIDKMLVVAVACAQCNEDCEKLVEIRVSGLESGTPKADVANSHVVEGRILRIVQWSDCSKGCLVELDDGSLFEFEILGDGGGLQPLGVEPLLEPCPWIHGIKDVAPFGQTEHPSDSHSRLVFGLSSRSRLYCHDIMLTDSASSFSVSMSHEYLCYATAGSRCQMRFLPLKEINSFDPLMGMDQNHLLQGYEPRNVEQGARIVAVLPARPMAVLQMPRGNLEGIYPRALVLHSVMSHIMAGEFGGAFRLMRTHKVDLNLIVDLDPVSFLEKGISKFFEQVTNIDHINLFISGLQDWNITTSRFPVPTWFKNENMTNVDSSTFDFSNKVNQVCKKARQTMLGMESCGRKEEGFFLLPVLSTFAKENPPRLDEALSLIKENALRVAPKASKKNPLFAEKAQSSIHYLAFLAEYELLFNTALGMYDYDMARAVARNSQMDPKVYLPLLKRLIALPSSFSKFEVDIRLKRFDAALKNLVQSFKSNEAVESFLGGQNDETPNGNRFESCMALIERHNLHKLGLQLFKDDAKKIHEIYLSLGESKLKEGRPDIALPVFLAAEPPHVEGAMRAARAAGDWKCFFSLLDEEENEKPHEEGKDSSSIRMEKVRQFAREIASEIVTDNASGKPKSKREKHMDAARILLDYGEDLIGAVDMLTRAECWSEGYRIAGLRSRPDLAKKCVDAAISFAYSSMDEFNERASGFQELNARYNEVLKLRKQLIATEGPEVPEALETDSLFSAATTASNLSLQSKGSTGSSTSNVTSSVISVKSVNTFTVVGDETSNRHRSKFNKGKDKKKKKKKKKEKRRRPGSEEELLGIVANLRASCPDSMYAETITETIRFLVFVRNYNLASELFERYNDMRAAIETSQAERIETTAAEKLASEKRSRHEGGDPDDAHLFVDLPIEKEVDDLICAKLPESLGDFFSIALTH